MKTTLHEKGTMTMKCTGTSTMPKGSAKAACQQNTKARVEELIKTIHTTCYIAPGMDKRYQMGRGKGEGMKDHKCTGHE